MTVICGIALGAAVFTSVRISVDASLLAFTRSMNLLAGRADAVVSASGVRVPESLVATLFRDPGVRAAAPVMSTYVRLAGRNAPSFRLIGIDPLMDAAFRKWTETDLARKTSAEWIDLMATPGALMVGPGLAADFGWHVGESVRLEHTAGTRSFTVVGILSDEGLGAVAGGRIAITDIATFQEFTDIFGKVDRIDLVLEKPIDARRLASIRSVLPPGVRLSPPSEARAVGTGLIRAYRLNLSVLSFAALFVGMFLVYSLVALNAASRRKEIAILRSLGARQGTVFSLFLLEGGLFGLLGWVLAVPAGAVLVRYLIGGVSQTISTLFVRVDAARIGLHTGDVLVSLGTTVFVAMAAALQPAMEATRVSPKAVMTGAAALPAGNRKPIRLALAGLVMVALVVPVSRLPGPPGIPLAGYGATMMLFIGFALMAPMLLRGVAAVLSPMLSRFGVSAGLAARYVRESGIRTAVSIGALITAVSLYTALVIMIHSFRGTVEIWVHQALSGDLFVSAALADANGFRDPMPADVIERLRHLATPATAVPSRRYSLRRGRFPYQIEAMDMAAFFRHGNFVWMRGDPQAARAGLIRGAGVVVSEVFSNRTGVKLGQRFRARIGPDTIDLPVLGIIRDYRTRGGIVYVDLHAMGRIHPDTAWTGVRYYVNATGRAGKAQLEALRERIIACCGDRVDMVMGKELRASVLHIFDETFAVTTVLLLIALVVAALGITTTMTILILERSRQLNTIFAIGADYGQIRRMILWEAALLVVTGEVAGLVCGLLLSYLLVYVINAQSFGWTFLYRVDVSALAFSVPLITASALAAALPALGEVFRHPPATLLRANGG